MIQLTILMFASFIKFSHQQCPTSLCDCINTNGVIKISCRDKQLTAIPTFTDTGVTYDEITFGSTHQTGCTYTYCNQMNRISTLPANAFANLRVKKIILTKNAISTYDSNAFAGLEGILEDLELEGNGNNAFPNSAISGLTNLEVLYLEHFSQQTMTSSNTLSTLPKLKQLKFMKINNLNNIQYNAFYTGPEQSKSPKFPLLNTFHLKDIPTLTNLPVQAIQELTELTELDISGTGITHIYAQTFSPLYKLMNLHITYNDYLTTIDSGAFDELYDTLEFLFLGNNGLQSLVSLSASNWQKLTQLNLQHNPIGTFQASDFSTLGSKVKYLNLDSCKLTSITRSMFNNLRGLHTLVLSNNEIQNVPASVFQDIIELTELRLNKQKYAMTLNDNSFSGIETTLNHLIINENNIDKPTFWRLIDKLPNLLELNAGKLNLQTIPDKAFKNNDKITILDLESNGISTLQEGSFYRLRDSLEVLTLTSNSITTISKCVFNGFTRLHQLHLSDNQLDCDCSLRWLHDWVQQQPDKTLAGGLVGSCSSPPALANQFLYEISSRNDLLCDPDYVEPTCTDLYATTTTSTTTTTAAPKNIVTIHFGQIKHTSVTVMWTIGNKESALTGLVFEAQGTNQPDKNLHKDTVSETVNYLTPGTSYTFCLKLQINNVVDSQYTKCKTTETVPLTIPTISLSFGQITETSINIIWYVSDRSDVSGYVLNINKGNVPFRTDQLVDKGKDQDTILGLEPNTYYTFCMYFKLNEVAYPQYEDCQTEKTNKPVENTTVVPTTPAPDSNIGIIVGAVVGVVVLIGVIVLIIVILVCVRKPPKKPIPTAAPVSFIPQPTGSLPQQGGTAKRFSKPKDGKEGAVGPDDIQIQTISNGGFDKDRFSAGNYQLLHEKDFHRPGSSASTSSGGATGHYVNDLSVDRPLPRTPYGVPDSKMGKSRGYVNTGFQGSADPLPQTANTYSEIDPSKEGARGERSEKVTII